MSFIEKNANLFLLALIIISSLGLVGATIYFQNYFQKINMQYNQKLTELDTVQKNLDTQKALLDKIKNELSLKSATEETLTQKFTEVRTEKENITAEKELLADKADNLAKDLSSAHTAQQKAEASQAVAEGNLRNCQASVLKLQTDVASYQSSISDINSRLTSCQNSINTYQSRLNTCQSTGGVTC